LAGASAIAIAAYFSEPVLQTLGFGQVNLVLMALVVLDLVAWRQARWSGVLTGIAVGIKLTPLVFVAYLLAVGRRRTAVVASASATATILVGLVVLPTPTRQYFLDLMWNPRRVGNVGYVGNQSLNGMWARLLPGRPVAHLLWLASAAAVFGLGIWTARRVHHRLGEPGGIAVAAVTGLLVSPISWSHHWVWWILPALVLCRTAWVRRSWGVLALCVAWTAPFYAGPFWFVPHLHHTDVPHGVGPQLVASTYVLVALVALVATATWLSRPSPTSAPEPAARVPLGRAAPSHAV
jgi:alpha-1,2-mannosyltransferase